MVDKAVVLRKLSELETYLRQVREYSGITLSEYHGDWKTQRIVERTLQMMIEICADIAGISMILSGAKRQSWRI